jgi:hypothetical protein
MAAAGFDGERYEYAHASLFLASVQTWVGRCAALVNGTLPLLPSLQSQVRHQSFARPRDINTS